MTPVILRRLEKADIPVAQELRRLAGWNQSEWDWAGYLDFEPEGCFVATLDGRIVGTATTITYARRFGWVGMVIVHPEQRRGGIGTALLNHSIEYLRARDLRCIKLDATPMGRNVYVPMGFRDEYDLARYEGVAVSFAAEASDAVEPLTAEHLPGVIAFDAAIFGAERRLVLESMSQRRPEWCFMNRGAGGVAGYIIAREGSNAVQIGPWLACDTIVAMQLLGAVFRRVAGRKVFIDMPGPNRPGQELMQRVKFTVQRGFTRMFLGENAHPGAPAQVFSTSGAEKG